ncbi:hypothetical protein A9Q96_14360 [Rhodobacterales bacterium 52_120_T64]|mgnify:CR=1 FL=1|nr:hypothetical protein A9Q96_14360 [Rhodobacterales bacterium 52_120_T64]
MKNVLLTTTALVLFAGAAAAEVSWSGGADIGYNDSDEFDTDLFYDANVDLLGSFDLGDGYAATISYGFDLEVDELSNDDNPTIEITAPFGSLKGGDLNDKGASEYFYKDRDGMSVDVENHDTKARFDVRALAEFGAFGVAVGTQDADPDTGLNFGAGGTFGDVTVGFGFDDEDNAGGQRTAVSADMAFGAASIGVSYASIDGGQDSTGIAVGYDVSADLSVGVYYADNSVDGGNYGGSVDYAMGDLTVGLYYDFIDAGDYNQFGIDASYALMDNVTLYVGYLDLDGEVTSDDDGGYVGVVYAINDNLSATISYAEGYEISGPEFRDGTTVMLSASF